MPQRAATSWPILSVEYNVQRFASKPKRGIGAIDCYSNDDGYGYRVTRGLATLRANNDGHCLSNTQAQIWTIG